MWIKKRKKRRSQSVKIGKGPYGFPMIEYKYAEEWEEEFHDPKVEKSRPPKKEKKNNSFRHRLLVIIGTIVIGLITNGLYDKINSGHLWHLFQRKTATLKVAAADYMAKVFGDLHVVIESLFY